METKKQYVSNRPAISMKELKRMFQYMTEDELERCMQENVWIKLDAFLKEVGKKNEAYRVRAERADVKRISISVEWRNHNPHASWSCHFQDGSYDSGSETCHGYGYDKESTVVAEIFNKCCSGMLWRMRKTKKEEPYGCRVKGTWFPHFSGGVGMSCYYRIAEFMGGKLECTASGKTYDHYTVTFPVKKQKVA